MGKVYDIFDPFHAVVDQKGQFFNPAHGSGYNPAGYLWSGIGHAVKPKVPGQTSEELQLQRAQLALIYKQDEDINAKKLRILRGENVNFASLLKSASPADAAVAGGAAGPPTSGGNPSRQPVGGGRGKTA